MATHKVQLKDLRNTLNIYSRNSERAVVRALRKSAFFGKTAVTHTIKKTKGPKGHKIRASGAYENPGNWVIDTIDGGAVLAPTTVHALFVERGRKPGHKPPFARILEWARQKKVVRGTKALKYYHTGTPRTNKIVKKIQWQIAKFGTEGKWPLRRTMPKIAKHAGREIKRAMKKVSKMPPGGKVPPPPPV